MTTAIISISILILVLLIVLVFADDIADRVLTSVYVFFGVLFLCFIVYIKSEKTTSIKHINGDRIYEKQYVINSDLVKVDSIYVLIKKESK